MRDIRIACFSACGEHLGEDLGLGKVTRFPGEASLKDWTQAAFSEADALIYIGACAIAVRAIAPFIKSKLSDPAVIALDETGAYVIPLLSGHIGGANKLAREIAERIQGCPVITTATDRRHTFAADSWAVEHGLGVINPEAVKTISSAVLEGQEIVLSVRDRSREALTDTGRGSLERGQWHSHRELHLVPRNIVAGIGCRKGTDPNYLETCFLDFCRKHSIEPASVGWVASVDLKSEEPAILQLSAGRKMPFLTYSAERLMKVRGNFTASEFVLRTAGTDNVCERAAVCAAEELAGRRRLETSAQEEWIFTGGELICPKEIYEGVTLAAVRLNTAVSWQWQ